MSAELTSRVRSLVAAGDVASLQALRLALTDPDAQRDDRPWAPRRWRIESHPTVVEAWREVVPLLKDLAVHPSADARVAAALLAQYAPLSELAPTLVDLARDSDHAVVVAALTALYELRAPGTADVVRAGLRSPVAAVRTSAAAALGGLGTQDDITALAELLRRDPWPAAASWAAIAAAEIGGDHACTVLLETVGQQPLEPVVWAGVRRALVHRWTAVRERLGAIIETADDEVAARAIEAFSEAGDPETAALAYAALDAEGPWRSTAGAWALARLGNPVGEAMLTGWIGTSNAEREACAIGRLCLLGSEHGLAMLLRRYHRLEMRPQLGWFLPSLPISLRESLIAHVDDPSPEVRRAAVDLLGVFGTGALVEPLLDLTTGADRALAVAAAVAVARLGSPHGVKQLDAALSAEPDIERRRLLVASLATLWLPMPMDIIARLARDDDPLVRELGEAFAAAARPRR